MAPESSSPAEIHFAYDRGIFASIPKKKGAKDGQDSTAIISKNNVYTAKLSDDTKEIRVDAAFLTGMAAQVAGAPKGSKVNISVGKDGSIQDSPPIDITDTVAERINPLFRTTPRYTKPEQRILEGLHKEIRSRGDADTIYERAANQLPDDFIAFYQEVKKKSLASARAFRRSEAHYISAPNLSTDEVKKRQQQIVDALKGSLSEITQ